MKNNIALNIRKVADKANKEAEKAKVALHEELVKTEIIPYLLEHAEKGKYQADLFIPGYDTRLVGDILQGMGFIVDRCELSYIYYLVVKW